MTQPAHDPRSAGPPPAAAGLPAARGWASWVVFTGILLVLAAAGQALEAVRAVTGDAPPEPLLVDDPTARGVVHLLVAVALGLTALGLLAGLRAARAGTVLITVLSVLAALASGPASSVRAVVVALLGLVTVYAVVVHGDELYSPSY